MSAYAFWNKYTNLISDSQHNYPSILPLVLNWIRSEHFLLLLWSLQAYWNRTPIGINTRVHNSVCVRTCVPLPFCSCQPSGMVSEQ